MIFRKCPKTRFIDIIPFFETKQKMNEKYFVSATYSILRNIFSRMIVKAFVLYSLEIQKKFNK